MADSLLDPVCPALCPGVDTLHRRPLVGKALRDIELIGIHAVIVLRIGNGGIKKLPDDLRPSFEEIFKPADTEEEKYMRRLVKAADKLSALIKCIGEINAGNTEFRTAKESTGKSIRSMYQELPEVLDFVNEFLSSYGSTLDELT